MRRLQYLFQVFQVQARVIGLPVPRLAKLQKSLYAHLFFALLCISGMGLISFTTQIEYDTTPISVTTFNLS